jgi:hypothetical protein
MLVLAFGYSAMTYRSTLETSGSPAAAWNSVIEIGVWAAAVYVVFVASVVGVMQISKRRERRLRMTFPNASVLSSAPLPQLKKALKGAVDSDGKPIVGLGLGYLTLMASSQGITVWRGWGQPYEICHWTWDYVVDVVPATSAERHRRSNGLEVTVQQNGASIVFPFIILGAGFGGLFPPSLDLVTDMGAQVTKLRP